MTTPSPSSTPSSPSPTPSASSDSTAGPLTVTVDELPQLQGTTMGPSEWRTITQEDIDVFADLTGDHNPIHVDEEVAAASVYGTRIAHGLLSLSIVVPHLSQLWKVTGVGMGINYGLNRVRFPAPTPAGGRVRASAEVLEVTELDGGWQVVLKVTYEVEGGTKPVCVAEFVLRYYR
ncbi:MaoC family dehydratase [Citricoccus sp. GCM10030269]|uniref:MaoC family dehydratase n=1 Tax=Citricoccus sp. GCM10030269 TaxID=3273388 RepID=UPI003611582D